MKCSPRCISKQPLCPEVNLRAREAPFQNPPLSLKTPLMRFDRENLLAPNLAQHSVTLLREEKTAVKMSNNYDFHQHMSENKFPMSETKR